MYMSKFFDRNLQIVLSATNNVPTQLQNKQYWFQPLIGTGSNERIGNQVFLKRVKVRVSFIALNQVEDPDVLAFDVRFRNTFVYDRQVDLVPATDAQLGIYQNPDDLEGLHGFLNEYAGTKWKVMYDERCTLPMGRPFVKRYDLANSATRFITIDTQIAGPEEIETNTNNSIFDIITATVTGAGTFEAATSGVGALAGSFQFIPGLGIEGSELVSTTTTQVDQWLLSSRIDPEDFKFEALMGYTAKTVYKEYEVIINKYVNFDQLGNKLNFGPCFLVWKDSNRVSVIVNINMRWYYDDQ